MSGKIFNEKTKRFTCSHCKSFVGKNDTRCKSCNDMLYPHDDPYGRGPQYGYNFEVSKLEDVSEVSKVPSASTSLYYMTFEKYPKALEYFKDFAKKADIPLGEVITNFAVLGISVVRKDVKINKN